MKPFGILAVVLVLFAMLAACGGEDDEQTPTPMSTGQGAASATATPAPAISTARPEEGNCEIAFAGDPASYPGGYRIYCVNADGSDLHPLTELPASDFGGEVFEAYPAWSPDGSQVAFARHGVEPGIYIVNVDGSDERLLAEGWATDIAWSSDGSRLLLTWFEDGWKPESRELPQLAVIDADGSNMQIISDHPDLNEEHARIAWPNWESDGTRILFQYLGPNTSDLYIVNVDGTDLQRIDTSDLDVYYGAADITWTPDGEAAAVRGAAPDERDIPGIFRIPLDGGEPERLTPIDLPPVVGLVHWSPDGGQMAYTSTTEDLSRIGERGPTDVDLYVLDIDSGSAQQVMDTADVAEAAGPWSPDGSRLLYLSFSSASGTDGGDQDPYANLQFGVVNVDGSNPVVVVERFSMRPELSSSAVWRPSPEEPDADTTPPPTLSPGISTANEAAQQEATEAAQVVAGQELVGSVCAACHTVAGTRAAGAIGPELTNFANNPQIAGTLANNEENLRMWLNDPPGVKPGTAMPTLGLSQAQVDALVVYLYTLDGS